VGDIMDNMWRCPDCETINSADKCIVCGKVRENTQHSSAIKINRNQQNSLKNDVKCAKGQLNENKQNPVSFSVRKKSNYKLGICAVCSVALFSVAAVAIINNNSKSDISGIPDLNAVQKETTPPELVVNFDKDVTNSIVTHIGEAISSVSDDNDGKSIMPSMLNLSLDDAEKLLNQMDLDYKVIYSSKKYVNVDSGCVYSQSPKVEQN